jgi:hypothetical protein
LRDAWESVAKRIWVARTAFFPADLSAFIHTIEVVGSNPAVPTLITNVNANCVESSLSGNGDRRNILLLHRSIEGHHILFIDRRQLG